MLGENDAEDLLCARSRTQVVPEVGAERDRFSVFDNVLVTNFGARSTLLHSVAIRRKQHFRIDR